MSLFKLHILQFLSISVINLGQSEAVFQEAAIFAYKGKDGDQNNGKFKNNLRIL